MIDTRLSNLAEAQAARILEQMTVIHRLKKEIELLNAEINRLNQLISGI